MVINGKKLLELAPIKGMHEKRISDGRSYGQSCVCYDIRLKQDIKFTPHFYDEYKGKTLDPYCNVDNEYVEGRFALASAIEEFQVPKCLVGVVHDKSSNARLGISIFNTVIEPDWHGFLTLEIVFHGNEPIHLPAGTPIAQVMFMQLSEEASYGEGKYQNQPDMPTAAIFEEDKNA